MDWRVIMVLLVGVDVCAAQTGIPDAGKAGHGRPALIATSDLAGFDKLPEARRRLIEIAIATAKDSPWLPYKFGGANPKRGGFDCSGAMYFVLRKAGFDPPRRSSDQHAWLERGGHLHKVSEEASDLDHPDMAKLLPGDLLFWEGTYAPTDARKSNITHIALYLGREKRDGRPVMINSTDGRSYRGRQANGYGVYDFRLPTAGSRSAFVGYGPPPGLDP